MKNERWLLPEGPVGAPLVSPEKARQRETEEFPMLDDEQSRGENGESSSNDAVEIGDTGETSSDGDSD